MSFYNRRVDIAVAAAEWWDKRKKTPVYLPPITVSREIGSGGGIIAKMVSKKLGFLLVDQQLIEEIAKKSNYTKEHIKTIDERTRPFLEEFGLALFAQHFMSNTEFFRRLREEIKFFANIGSVVILGRGGNIILGHKALNIRIISPVEKRIANIVENDEFSEKKAREIVVETDKKRTQFIKEHFSVDVEDPSLYDLIIDTEQHSKDMAVKLIISAYYDRFPIKSPKSDTLLY